MLEQLRKLNFWFFLILVWTCWMMNSFNGQSPWYQANPGAQGTSHNWKLKNIREFRKRNLWNKLWKFGNNRKAQKCTYLNLSEHFPFFWFWMMISSNQFLNFQKNMYTNLEMNKWFRKNMFKNVPNSYIWTLLSCFSILVETEYVPIQRYPFQKWSRFLYVIYMQKTLPSLVSSSIYLLSKDNKQNIFTLTSWNTCILPGLHICNFILKLLAKITTMLLVDTTFTCMLQGRFTNYFMFITSL